MFLYVEDIQRGESIIHVELLGSISKTNTEFPGLLFKLKDSCPPCGVILEKFDSEESRDGAFNSICDLLMAYNALKKEQAGELE